MSKLSSWLIDEVRFRLNHPHPLPKPAYEVMEATVDALRKRAAYLIRNALVKAIPDGPGSWHYNPGFHAAVNHIAELAAAAVFDEIPLTDDQKKANLDALNHLSGGLIYEKAKLIDQWPTSNAGTSVLKSAADLVTKEKIYKALEQAKSGLPAVKATPAHYTPAATSGVASAMDHSLKPPKPKDPPKEEDEALEQLWNTVAKKSDELLGIKQDAKKNELMGLDPEEI